MLSCIQSKFMFIVQRYVQMVSLLTCPTPYGNKIFIDLFQVYVYVWIVSGVMIGIISCDVLI